MKTVLVVPDGMGIRNFLCSSFIDLALAEGEVVVWHALADSSLAPHHKRWGNEVRWCRLPYFREGLTERILRQAKIDAQLHWFYIEDNSDAVFSFRHPSKRLVSRLTQATASILGKLCAHPQRAAWLDRLHEWVTSHASYLSPFETFLQQEKPDVLFCTHQRASRAVPAMVAARKLGIPTATFIYSWDNLPKGRMAVHADHYLVWSAWMAEEMGRYYPEVAPEQVHVVGTPQFEHYFRPELVEIREEFLERLGLDATRSVICFSGDDIATSPYDPHYLADVAAAVRQIPAETRPQILFRRCPVDRSDRYAWVLTQYPEIAVSDPLWVQTNEGDWTQVVPTVEDISLLVNVVHHCDLVINIGSTMAMDFAILDKPAIFLNYDPADTNHQWRIENIYRLPHFRSVHRLQPVHWATSPNDLSTLLEHVLKNVHENSTNRFAWLQTLVAHPLPQVSQRLLFTLVTIATKF